MAYEYFLVYNIDGKKNQKKIELPAKAEDIRYNKRSRHYEGQRGIKISYIFGSKRQEKIIPIPEEAKYIGIICKDILLKSPPY